MNVNPPRNVRVALYLVALFVAPFAIYGQSKGWLGDPEAALISAYLVLINGLALANVSNATSTQAVVEKVVDGLDSKLVDAVARGAHAGAKKGSQSRPLQ